MPKNKDKGEMTVEEAGHKGGQIGGPKVKRLIEEGKEYEEEHGKMSEKEVEKRTD